MKKLLVLLVLVYLFSACSSDKTSQNENSNIISTDSTGTKVVENESKKEKIYIGLMSDSIEIEMRVMMEEEKEGDAKFVGSFEIKGKEKYEVKGLIENKEDVKMRLYKNDEKVQDIVGVISESSPVLFLHKKGYGKDEILVEHYFELLPLDLFQQTLKPQMAKELCDYSNEIFKTTPRTTQFYNPLRDLLTIVDGQKPWENMNYDFILKSDSIYENKGMNESIKKITKVNVNHFSYGIEGRDFVDEPVVDKGTEFWYNGTINHVLLEGQRIRVLEFGYLNTRIASIDKEEETEVDENGEEHIYFDVEPLFFHLHFRVLERSQVGLWLDISEQVLPTDEEILIALQSSYANLRQYIDPFYIGDSGRPCYEDDSMDEAPFEFPYNYICDKIIKGAAENKEFEPKNLNLSWKGNAVYFSAEKGQQLYWNGEKFELKSVD